MLLSQVTGMRASLVVGYRCPRGTDRPLSPCQRVSATKHGAGCAGVAFALPVSQRWVAGRLRMSQGRKEPPQGTPAGREMSNGVV